MKEFIQETHKKALEIQSKVDEMQKKFQNIEFRKRNSGKQEETITKRVNSSFDVSKSMENFSIQNILESQIERPKDAPDFMRKSIGTRLKNPQNSIQELQKKHNDIFKENDPNVLKMYVLYTFQELEILYLHLISEQKDRDGLKEKLESALKAEVKTRNSYEGILSSLNCDFETIIEQFNNVVMKNKIEISKNPEIDNFLNLVRKINRKIGGKSLRGSESKENRSNNIQCSITSLSSSNSNTSCSMCSEHKTRAKILTQELEEMKTQMKGIKKENTAKMLNENSLKIQIKQLTIAKDKIEKASKKPETNENSAQTLVQETSNDRYNKSFQEERYLKKRTSTKSENSCKETCVSDCNLSTTEKSFCKKADISTEQTAFLEKIEYICTVFKGVLKGISHTSDCEFTKELENNKEIIVDLIKEVEEFAGNSKAVPLILFQNSWGNTTDIKKLIDKDGMSDIS